MAKYDWDKIKAEYVEAPSEADRPTYEQLSQKYGCGFGTLRDRAGKEGWKTQADMFQTKIRQKRNEIIEESVEGKINLLASEQAKFDLACFQINLDGLHEIARHFKTVKLKAKDDPNHLLSPSSLNLLLQSLEKAQKIGRASLSDSNPDEQSCVVIAREDG